MLYPDSNVVYSPITRISLCHNVGRRSMDRIKALLHLLRGERSQLEHSRSNSVSFPRWFSRAMLVTSAASRLGTDACPSWRETHSSRQLNFTSRPNITQITFKSGSKGLIDIY